MKKIVIANWKCNPATRSEARKLFSATAKIATSRKNVEVIVCPPSVFISAHNSQKTPFKIGAQNIFWEMIGAYTGEMGPRMVKSSGASYAIVGHSERRERFGETNEDTHNKVQAALAAGLRVILCVGERSREGDAATYAAYVKEEVQVGLRGVTTSAIRNILIAYEPIWAIGSDEADTPERTLEMTLYIRKIVADLYNHKIAQEFSVLYGGSVNTVNARSFLQDGGVDGLLVGRASLDPKMFSKIIEATELVTRNS